MFQSSTGTKNHVVSDASVRSVDIQQLHERCGVYTQPALVRRTLDVCGWTGNADLSKACLLEPCAGDGSFLLEAARRLFASLGHQRIKPSRRILEPRILAFELLSKEAAKARADLVKLLVTHGLAKSTSRAIAASWIRTGDFLLHRPKRKRFTHIVGNPPYVRWSRVPESLRLKYEARLSADIARGDLQLPFLSESVCALAAGGRLAFVCSDRWRHMGYGAEFKAKLVQRVKVETHRVVAHTAFRRRVSACVDLLAITNVAPPVPIKAQVSVSKRRTLAELGCSIGVGPALGYESAYVGPAASLQVEEGLLSKFVRPKQIGDGSITLLDLWVIAMHDSKGQLLKLADYPLLARHLEKSSARLRARSIVARGRDWYSPIDRVQKSRWERPKLLLPEMAKIPRLALDRSGAIPSHGVYAIFAESSVLEDLSEKLSKGRFAKALARVSPLVNGGYRRCYRRFLEMITL